MSAFGGKADRPLMTIVDIPICQGGELGQGIRPSASNAARTAIRPPMRWRLRSDICIWRQIEPHPARPIRDDEEVRIRYRVIAPHKILIPAEVLIEMRKSCLEPSTKDIFPLFRYAFVEQR